MVSLDTIASAFGFADQKSAEWSTLGKVTAVGDGTLTVIIGGESSTECADYCGASIGDVVLVLVSGGQARAIARKGGSGGGGEVGTYYGTCSTAAGTAEKAVVCEGYTLTKGAIVGVLFTTANSLGPITLNVNSTGALPVYVGTTRPNGTTNSLEWSANTMLLFQYDGEYYRYITGRAAGNVIAPDGGGSWYGTCSTAATTAAKVCGATNFLLTRGAVVHMAASTASTVTGTITLNVSSTGSKNVYVNGVSTSSANPLYWNAGDVLTFVYSGSYYYYVGGATPLPITKGGTGLTSTADFLKTVTGNTTGITQSQTDGEITVTIPTGYSFVCWVQPRTNGWVGLPYVGTWSVSGQTATAHLWWTNQFWYDSGSNSISVEALCIFTG